jgi:molybdopterin-guanine dinucleotide biosynthesis protein A
LNNALIVLSGGLSQRFGQDKCLRKLAGKTLVTHVLDRVATVADEIVVVAGSMTQQSVLSQAVGQNVRVIVDSYGNHSPLIGALTGLENVEADYALLLPCDAAFVSRDVAKLLLNLCQGRSAAIPRWPDGKIEPLQAAYNVKLAKEAAQIAYHEGKRDMIGMISCLRNIRYISTLVLQQYDKKLGTFFNINTVEDWKRAEAVLKRFKQ